MGRIAYIAGRVVEELEVGGPFGNHVVSLKTLYPGKSFVGYLPVFENVEDAQELNAEVITIRLSDEAVGDQGDETIGG